MMKNICLAAFSCIATIAFASQSSAAIVVVAPTPTTPGSVEITQDINFTITTSTVAMILVLDEWVTSDGGMDATNISPDLAFSINGGPTITRESLFYDNFNGVTGTITANDGLFLWTSFISLDAGDTLTVKSGTYTLQAAGFFNPQVTQTFTGNVFLTDSNGFIMSNVVAIPEPSSTFLMGVGACLIAMLRRRSHK